MRIMFLVGLDWWLSSCRKATFWGSLKLLRQSTLLLASILLQSPRQAEGTDEKKKVMMLASPGGSVRPGTLCKTSWASPEDVSLGTKIDLIIDFSRRRISEIKLKRTDTTLDLSQKAKRAEEKRWNESGGGGKYISRGDVRVAKGVCATWQNRRSTDSQITYSYPYSYIILMKHHVTWES